MSTDEADSGEVHEALARLLTKNMVTDHELRSIEDFLPLVSGAARVQTEANKLLHASVASARGAGATWQSIGATLGMTKQAAQKRFALPGIPRFSELDPGERIIGPTTAFDVLHELAVAGRYGWHSVEFGATYHRVVRSDTQWEHARSTMSPGRAQRLCAEGWEVIGASFPYTYLKRDTGTPALEEPPS